MCVVGILFFLLLFYSALFRFVIPTSRVPPFSHSTMGYIYSTSEAARGALTVHYTQNDS